MFSFTNEDFSSYEEARKLTEETSKTDPDSEPFKSRYKARELLQELKSKIENAIEERSPEDVTLQSACLLYHLGLNYTETEEISGGEEYLGRCNEKLAEHHTNSKCVVTAIGTLNQLGIIWFKRTETQKSLAFLKEAERIYHEFITNVDEVPWGIHDLFQPESSHKSDHERKAEFENIHTLTLYYLAQVYGKLEQSLKVKHRLIEKSINPFLGRASSPLTLYLSAKLCNITLKRQLESGQYDPTDWALNSATLSQYFLMRDDYHRARHCLASASCIFQEVLQKHPEAVEMTGDDIDGDIEEIQHRKVDIAMCWLKYCVALLTYSTDEEEPSQDVGGNDNEEELCEEEHEDYKIPEKFHTLELDAWEDKVSDSKAETFEEARAIFLAGQQFITESKQYYVFDGHVTDYIEIVQDHSKLFRLLTKFEPDLERRCKMHKRRVDLLVPIIEEVNPQFFLHILQELTFEVGETYHHMVDLKLEIKHQSEGTVPTSHVIKKINTLISKSIEYFKKFHDLLRSPQGVMPEQFEENLVRPVLIAHFYIARLYGKYTSPEMAERIQWLETSGEHYKFVADYCKKFPAARKVVEAEVELCEEMVQFTPVRIDSMRRGIF